MDVVIAGFVRTPIGKFGGALKDVKTPVSRRLHHKEASGED
jgi:acetyl-CoA acetyltransferase